MGISAEMMRQEIGFWREQAAASVQASALEAAAPAVFSDADDLALQLRVIFHDAAVLNAMSAKLRDAGILTLGHLQGLSLDELEEEVAVLNLNKLQLRRLFTAVAAVDGGSEGHKSGGKN
jgi:hypothetical protein